MTATPLTAEQRSLVEQNIDLAHHFAQLAFRKNTFLDIDDLVSAAYEGLVKAAHRFDPSRADVVNGVADISGAFSGFARKYIHGAIIEWQRKQDHVSKHKRSTYKMLQSLGLEEGRSAEELSDLTGMPVEKILLLISAIRLTDRSWDFEADSTNAAFSRDAYSLEGSVLGSMVQKAFVEAWDALPDLQRLVIALRYYAGMTLKQVSSTIEVRLSIVSDAHAEALMSLHEAMVREATSS